MFAKPVSSVAGGVGGTCGAVISALPRFLVKVTVPGIVVDEEVMFRAAGLPGGTGLAAGTPAVEITVE